MRGLDLETPKRYSVPLISHQLIGSVKGSYDKTCVSALEVIELCTACARNE